MSDVAFFNDIIIGLSSGIIAVFIYIIIKKIGGWLNE